MNEIENCREQDGNGEFKPNGYDIAFENVGFAYTGDETVLQNVSFKAKQGEVTALIGRRAEANPRQQSWLQDFGMWTRVE